MTVASEMLECAAERSSELQLTSSRDYKTKDTNAVALLGGLVLATTALWEGLAHASSSCTRPRKQEGSGGRTEDGRSNETTTAHFLLVVGPRMYYRWQPTSQRIICKHFQLAN